MITFRTLRERKNFTLDYVAERVGVTIGTIKKYESSERLPKDENYILLQQALECSDSDMITAFANHKLKHLKVYSRSLKKKIFKNKSK